MRPSIPLRSTLAAAAWLACAAAPTLALAQTDTVVVTGAPRAQRVLDAPYAITAVDAAALRDAGPMVNLSEALVAVPGLVVNNRNNYAQDLQTSARGFGARAGFGVRGLRLYTDGIPASMPDGQGQVAHFDLAGAQRVEVLRGPYSVLYGNSSGGVIALFGAPVTTAQGELGVDAGSFGLRQARAGLAAPLGNGFDLRASVSKLETDGFRPQGAADRRLANVRLGWQGANDRVVLLVSDHAQDAQDPLGLSQADLQADPHGTAAVALQYNTRKTIAQTQAGVNWRHQFADGGVLRESSLSLHSGKRSVVQYLAIPPLTQRNAGQATPTWQRHGGGVIDFDRRYEGVEARLQFGWGGVEAVAGVALERQTDDRRGYENFTGPVTNPPAAPTVLGVLGDPRRDETNSAESRDAFLQADWALSPTLSATAGLRTGRVRIDVEDRYIKGLNGDDSGSLRFDYTNPVLGLRWKLAPAWVLHASVARGFESPTLGELAYSADNSGFNKTLQGQTSRQAEVGSKWRSPALDVDATLFVVHTDDEIGVRSNTGGRASFQNVGRTRRHGAELATTWRPATGLKLQAALSLLHADYADGFTTCTSAPCPTPNNPAVAVPAGNRIAGTQRANAWAQAAWRAGPLGGEWAVEWRAMARTAANDLNTAAAPGYGLVHLRWSGKLALGPSDALELLARVDNLLDRDHVGSVIVNDGNGRFYEPGTPRNLLLSARWQHRF
ncbi:MAG: TonB-dependent receptor [Burkholderiaceae bacterium]|nr:TonB-dependent receptor [Burkholderiaceae bacterium]